MITITKNIFSNSKSKKINIFGVSVYSLILEELKEELNSGFQIEVVLNNNLLEKENYDYIIKKEDNVDIVVKQNMSILISTLINFAVSFAISWLLNKFFAPHKAKIDEVPGGDVFTTHETQIRARKNAVIPEIFGSFKTYPDLISPPLYRYNDAGEQEIYLTTCVGIGEYSFDNAYINNTPISDLFLANNRDCEGKKSDMLLNCITKNTSNFKIAKIEPGKNIMSAQSTVGSKYNYIVKEIEGVANFDLQNYDSSATGKLTSKNELNKTESIKKIEIDVVAEGGLYRQETDDDGDIHVYEEIIEFGVNIFHFDRLGNKVYDRMEVLSFSDKTSKPVRKTFEITITGDNKFIEFYNKTQKQELGSKTQIVNHYTIERVKVFLEEDQSFSNLTLAVFKIVTNATISQKNSLKIALSVTRKGIKTLDKVISYIWSSAGFNYLELKGTENVTESYTCNAKITQSMSVFQSLQVLLSARALMLLPTLHGFKIKKDEKREALTYIYDKSNIKKDSLRITYNFTHAQANDGVKGVYISNTGEKKEEIYPGAATRPEEVRLYGISDVSGASAYVHLGYKKKLYNVKTAEFETELDGFASELEDKIGITEYYLNDSYVANKIAVNGSSFILDKEVYITDNSYAIIRTGQNSLDEYVKIVTDSNKWTRTLELEGVNPLDYDNIETAFVIGEEQAFINYYVVKKIEPNNNNTLKITAQNYDERVYN